jgi:hypothetical protein
LATRLDSHVAPLKPGTLGAGTPVVSASRSAPRRAAGAPRIQTGGGLRPRDRPPPPVARRCGGAARRSGPRGVSPFRERRGAGAEDEEVDERGASSRGRDGRRCHAMGQGALRGVAARIAQPTCWLVAREAEDEADRDREKASSEAPRGADTERATLASPMTFRWSMATRYLESDARRRDGMGWDRNRRPPFSRSAFRPSASAGRPKIVSPHRATNVRK